MPLSLCPHRLVIKISGESLTGNGTRNIDPVACANLAKALATLRNHHFEIALVLGGGNLCRGIQLHSLGMPRAAADQIGMLATIMNGIAIKQALQQQNIPTRAMSALECPTVAESFHWEKAQEYLKQKTILILVGGTGNPFCTTDTAAALRACEIDADLLLKLTKVDGVYSQDPLLDPSAMRYSQMTYEEYLAEDLKVMDATAVALCRAQRLPIRVCHMRCLLSHHLADGLKNGIAGTLIYSEA